MQNRTPQPPDKSAPGAERIGAEADRWLARLNDGALTPEEARAFNLWLAADPAHEREFRHGQSAMRAVQLLRGESDLAAWMRPSLYERLHGALHDAGQRLQEIARPGRVFAAAGLLAAGAAALVFVSLQPPAPPPAAAPAVIAAPGFPLTYRTRIAEIREIALSDGSLVTLGAASVLDVRFTGGERRVILSEGEAFFDVTPDPGRPFIVAAGPTLVRVLGTRFGVNLGQETVDIAVLEGEVEVIRPEDAGGAIRDSDIKHVLTAGQKVGSPKTGRVRPVETVDAENVAAWRRGELIWVDRPVRDIIADLNRYSDTRIILARTDLADLDYTLALQADEIDTGVRLLAAALGLDVRVRADGGLILQ